MECYTRKHDNRKSVAWVLAFAILSWANKRQYIEAIINPDTHNIEQSGTLPLEIVDRTNVLLSRQLICGGNYF